MEQWKFKPIEWRESAFSDGTINHSAFIGDDRLLGCYNKFEDGYCWYVTLEGFRDMGVCKTKEETRAKIEQAYEEFKNIFAERIS